jgi:dephospho-CoA kinase
MIYPDEKIVIGITGGMGCGKSSFTRILEKNGAIAIYADTLAKFYTSENSPIKDELVEIFGSQSLDSKGVPDRNFIAQQVFSDSQKLTQLTEIIHPLVRTETRKIIANAPPKSIIAWEVPLLFETHGEEICSYTVCVYLPLEEAFLRTQKRDGILREDFESRMKNQLDINKKIALSDFTIENSGSLEDLESKALEILRTTKPRE